MLDGINEMLGKIPKVLNSYDYNSSFYKKNYLNKEREGNDNIFDIEKFTNYIWFLSDIQDIEGCDILYNINYLNESKDIHNLSYDLTIDADGVLGIDFNNERENERRIVYDFLNRIEKTKDDMKSKGSKKYRP